MKKDLKKLTILHFNDLHGDFLAKQVDDQLLEGPIRPDWCLCDTETGFSCLSRFPFCVMIEGI
ncbi:MAG: hypothetical protein IJ390_02805 [Lachnospiraceae bacterium]|nr:hypothetical protein [Lachnospiraceae bacterium]